MDSLNTGPLPRILSQLFDDAQRTDAGLMASFLQAEDPARLLDELLDAERHDVASTYERVAHNFLAVTPAFGRFLYQCARACRARLIVEFGTSMGISTLHLAAALRDMGGGRLIGSELVAGKVIRARAHLNAAGLGDQVEIREGNALETLADVPAPIDLLLLDGAWSLYLPVLQMLEPRLASGALVIAENAFDAGYLAYVRDPSHGYLSQSLPVDPGRGNEFSVRTR